MQGPVVLHGPITWQDVDVKTANPARPGVPTELFEDIPEYRRWSRNRLFKNFFTRNKALAYLAWHASRHTPKLSYTNDPWGKSTCVQCQTSWPCETLMNSGFPFERGQFVVAAFQSMSYIGFYRRLGRILYPRGAYRGLIFRHDNYRHTSHWWGLTA